MPLILCEPILLFCVESISNFLEVKRLPTVGQPAWFLSTNGMMLQLFVITK